jgi:hypothetical protein
MWAIGLTAKMLSMNFLLAQPLAMAHDEDAIRAGRRNRLSLRKTPQRAALLGVFRGRRVARAAGRAAHAA